MGVNLFFLAIGKFTEKGNISKQTCMVIEGRGL
jgi:hypothetical protein